MNSKGITTTLDKFLHWITRLALLNLLFIVFSVAGLIVGGLFPSMAATLGVSRQWVMGNHNVKVWKTFKRIYREEFKTSNVIGWLLTLIGGLFYFNYQIMSENQVVWFVPFAFYLVIFIYLIVILWVFPLNVHNYASIIQQIKNAFIIGVAKLHLTITIMLFLFALMYFSLEFPVLLVFFTFSIGSFIWMWMSMHVFSQVLSN